MTETTPPGDPSGRPPVGGARAIGPGHAKLLAWGLWTLAVLTIPSGPVLQSIIDPRLIAFSVGLAAVQLCTATVGAIIARRLPGNAIGWLLLAIGTGLGLTKSVSGYGRLGFHTSGGLPGEKIAVWLGAWTWGPLLVGGTLFLLLLFPTGRFLTRGWKRFGVGCFAFVAMAGFSDALAPTLGSGRMHPNPMAARGWLADVVNVTQKISNISVLPVFVLAVAALVVRLRRSAGVERQQLKWITYAASLAAVGLGSGIASSNWAGGSLFVLGEVGLAAIPIATGIAILRYRLYDIDVVINRTLVYGALTVTLAGTYIGSVLLLQLVLSSVTAGSGLAVAGSTLSVAAMFQPGRRRIQAAVDRRFYRRKYDAARTIEAFGASLREEVDLDALGDDLRALVRDAMQPAHVTLWLRPK
ncbi:MAG: hypothetical protein M3071_19855 [Actinomycetota bacterium]|nr:hypothetical protein [Actinomycetota bacterium]